MKAFRYPLDRILHWRRMQLELEQAAMQRLVQRRLGIENALLALERDRSAAELSIRRAGVLQSRDLQTLSAYQQRITREKTTLLQKQGQLEREISAQLTKSTEAHRRVKLLERLRERRLHDWTGAMQAEAESFAAEAWLGRWPILKAGDEECAIRLAPHPAVDRTIP